MWPEDFQLKSSFGIGHDWPIGYNDLEPFYEEAERIMDISGPSDTPYPRRGALPLPPHPLSSVDVALQRLLGPKMWVAAPSARASKNVSSRSKCCANGVCGLCPVDAKFRIMNGLQFLYDQNPQIKLIVNAAVTHVIIEGGRATGVRWLEGEVEREAKADLVFLGMNAIFNPAVLIRSGDTNEMTGKRINEQVSSLLTVDLGNMNNFDGGTHITGLGYKYYGGNQRKRRASCLIEHYNAPPSIRIDLGKWRKRAVFKIVAENIPSINNSITLKNDQVHVRYDKNPNYVSDGIIQVAKCFLEDIEKIDKIEGYSLGGFSNSEGHALGTTAMSNDRSLGVVDSKLRHHDISNLLVGGSGSFVSGSASNPSLTIAALSLKAANQI